MSRSFTRSALAAGLALPLAATLFSACSDDFASCQAQRTCAPSDGANSGGASFNGGSSSGGAALTAGAGGDVAGGHSNPGGWGGSGGADFGTAGTTGSSGSDDGGAAGGAAGSNGGTDGTSGGGAETEGGSGGHGGFGGEGGSSGDEPRCGDATVDAGEACDDGNQDRADGCRPDCSWGPKQVVAGPFSSCVLFGNGAAKCWGLNHHVLAQGDDYPRGDEPGEMGAALSFIHVGNRVGSFSALSIHVAMACGVVRQDLWCWGSNAHGQLGQGDAMQTIAAAPVLLNVGGPVANVSVGNSFACALLSDGSVKCWGHGLYGKLGVGHEEDVGDEPNEMGNALRSVQFGEPASQISIKEDHSCALLRSGKVVCWGRGGSRLGQGTTGDAYSYGDTADERTPPEVPLGAGAVATSIGVGSTHSCAILGGLLKCWGSNAAGKLGLGLAASEALGDAPDELGSSLPIVPITPTLGADPVMAIHPGVNHTCALLRSGGVKCWGAPGSGRIAQPDVAPLLGNVGDDPGELSSLPVIDFGAGVRVRSLATGVSHACALLSTGDVKCWGVNQFGQLGLGHTSAVGTLASELGADMKAVALE